MTINLLSVDFGCMHCEIYLQLVEDALFVQKDSNSKRVKASSYKDENGSSKVGGESSSAGGTKPAEKSAEPPKDYIHVRARRGQATDSHSLAERVILFSISWDIISFV